MRARFTWDIYRESIRYLILFFLRIVCNYITSTNSSQPQVGEPCLWGTPHLPSCTSYRINSEDMYWASLQDTSGHQNRPESPGGCDRIPSREQIHENKRKSKSPGAFSHGICRSWHDNTLVRLKLLCQTRQWPVPSDRVRFSMLGSQIDWNAKPPQGGTFTNVVLVELYEVPCYDFPLGSTVPHLQDP